MRFSISRHAGIETLVFCVFGIYFIVMEIWIYQATNKLSVIFSVLGIICIVFGILIFVSSKINCVYIDKKKIMLYYRNKQKKSLELKDVKRLIICQICFHGARNQSIVFDDGTFYNKKVTKRQLFSRKMLEQESWIVIEYSDRRFEEIRRVLKDCPIDVIKPDQY